MSAPATTAFVLAAGLGTRLRPFTDRLPKPAWPLFGEPLVALQLRQLAGAGVTRAVVNLHHLPQPVIDSLDGFAVEGLRVEFSEEDEILGTGGALAGWGTARLLEETGEEGALFLVNADTYRGFELASMSDFHRARAGAATLSLAPAGGEGRPGSGPIGIDPQGRIVRFLDARAPGLKDSVEVVGCEFTGVHLFGRRVLDEVAALREGGRAKFCINADIHRALVAGGERLYGYLDHEGRYWSDMGTPERYLGAHFALLEGDAPPEGLGGGGAFVMEDITTPAGGLVRAPCYLGSAVAVGAGAVAGPFAVLGAGVALSPGALVSRAVLWDGVSVGGVLSECIAAPWGEALTVDGRVVKL